MAKEKVIGSGAILGFFLIVYLIDQLCKELFPYFLILTMIVFIVALILTVHNNDFSIYTWIVFVILFVLTLITAGCIHFFEKTQVGTALSETGEIVNDQLGVLKDSEELVKDITKNATKDTIDAVVESTNPNDPNIRNIADTSKVLIDQS